jgi:AbrB family looped-hinge helix DNA binding protein
MIQKVEPQPHSIKIGTHGRTVIPAALRRAMDLQSGEELVARLAGEQLILERRETVERRLKARFAHIPSEVDLASELLAERREAAKREATG